MKGRSFHVINHERPCFICDGSRINEASLVAPPEDKHCILIHSNCGMRLSPLRLKVPSDFNMIELVSGDIKLVDLVQTSIEVELVLEKRHRIVHSDG